MYDLFGDLIQIGDLVLVPSPNETDIHNCEFEGFVSCFHGDFITVEDQEGNSFDIEPERVILSY